MTEAPAPGDALQRLAQAELAELLRELRRARNGRDRAVHQARKILQRLRAQVRLMAPLDRAWAERENQALRQLRRRLGTLRDAWARHETFLLLASRARWREHATLLRELARAEAARHALAWQRHPPDGALWRAVGRAADGLAARLPDWPFAALRDPAVESALSRARRALRKRVRAAHGVYGHRQRHDLRRGLRRYANLRRAAAGIRGSDDADADTLLALAKRCGHEGDLWLALCSARAAQRRDPRFAPLVAALQEARRTQCRHHDRALQRAGLD
jgi:hypothetical protein